MCDTFIRVHTLPIHYATHCVIQVNLVTRRTYFAKNLNNIRSTRLLNMQFLHNISETSFIRNIRVSETSNRIKGLTTNRVFEV